MSGLGEQVACDGHWGFGVLRSWAACPVCNQDDEESVDSDSDVDA